MSDVALAAPVIASVPVAASAAVEAPPIVVEPVAPAPTPTLLSDGGETPVEVPAASAPEGETAASSPAAEPVVEPQPEQPAPEAEPAVTEVAPVSYEPFKFAEGMVIAPEDENLAKFTEFAGAKGLSQEDAQGLVDLYSSQASKFADELQHSLTQRQFDTFADTVKGWEQQFRGDPEFKNRVDTVVNDARRAIAMLGGSEADIKETRDILLASGTGNHRAIIRPFANAMSRYEKMKGTLLEAGLGDNPAVQRAIAIFENKEGRAPPRGTPTTARSGSPADRRYARMTE